MQVRPSAHPLHHSPATSTTTTSPEIRRCWSVTLPVSYKRNLLTANDQSSAGNCDLAYSLAFTRYSYRGGRGAGLAEVTTGKLAGGGTPPCQSCAVSAMAAVTDSEVEAGPVFEKDAQPAVSATRVSGPTSIGSSLSVRELRLVSNSHSLVQSNSLTKSDAVGRSSSGKSPSPARRTLKHTADARVVTPSGCCSLGTAKIRRCWSFQTQACSLDVAKIRCCWSG